MAWRNESIIVRKFESHKFNHFFMEEAFKEAEAAFKEDEIPVGSIIVNKLSGEIIARAHNIIEQERNPILHAEIVAINQACQVLASKNLRECDIYITLEPCSMCAAAIAFARIGRV